MFLKIIKLNNCLLRATGLRFCSQMTKISDNLTKISKQKESEKKSEEKSVSQKEKFEIENVVKTEEFMDRIWEVNQTYDHKTEYHKITDPYFEAHYPLNNKLDRIVNRGIITKIGYTYKEKAKDWVKYREENQQKYVARRHAKLGPELAVANFVVVRGGRVRFKHCPNIWATSLDHFPEEYDPRYQLIAVDASHTKLRFEGIDNFQQMYSLEELDLSDNKLDDWSCDKIGRMFRNSNLIGLNLSNNPLISHRGIESLHWVRSLKTLKIKGTNAAKYPFLELLINSFNDLVPECNIIYE